MTTIAIRLLLAIAFLYAFLTYFTPAPPKATLQFCYAEPLGAWYPCDWIPMERAV